MRLATETVLSVSAASVAYLLGQVAETPTIPGFGNLNLSNLTATGILGFYAWHTATRTIPGLIKDFREESREQREAFRQELAEEREHHRSTLDGIRESWERRP